MKRKFVLLCAIFVSNIAFAAVPTCKPHPFLETGFNIDHFKHCQANFKNCPKTSGLPDYHCVLNIVKKIPECNQLQQLSSYLKASPASFSIEKADKFYIVDQLFAADGQHHYYIISPAACMVKTNIDPRDLSPSLRKEYKTIEFMTINHDKPSMEILNDKTTFNETIKVTQTCVACEVVGWAKIQFIFDKHGNLLKTNLESFSKEKQA